MSELIEYNDKENVIVIGNEQFPISLKVYQDIYHQITGRTEKISKKYSDNILLDFSEIEQLHYKIMQLCDVHTVIANNEVISVFHEKERKEQFTSFERFKAYNSNATKPTISVVLRYNFSIILPDRKQTQEYIITIKLTSRVTMLQAMEEEIPPFMRGRFVSFADQHTAEVSVEYADYIVARSYLEAFDEWIEGCNSKQSNRFLDLAQAYSYVIPKALKLLMSSVLIFYCLKSVPTFLSSTSPQDWGRFFVIFGGAFYFVISISETSGRIIEKSIDSIQLMSYLKLNKGDEKLISKFSERNKSTIFRFIGGCVLTLILGVISSKLSVLI
ncbi:hypothetical protein G3495_14490 [Shewanella baltica]|uniref:hypothetical protein n=1 Tax=Shewanella baltica TaxID=62322 RepID=UPI00217F1AA6|nr:hypothetical protein [Shewanella baltica]MCS6236322.1 hypothetical protein [Shewanella baltica]MCS6269500.1 hypothetical protein [Shewanella baltica]